MPAGPPTPPLAEGQGAGFGSGGTSGGAAGGRLVVPALDGFRGLAALTVVLYHVTYGSGRPPLGGLRSVFVSGYMGVDFFFVLSGFVLFLPTVLGGGRFGNVRAYGWRRAARIVPAYYVALVAAVLLQPLLTAERTAMPWSSREGVVSFLLHLSFLQHSVGLARNYAEGFLVIAVIWTLTVEATFYVVLPLVAGWYARHPFTGFGIALALSLAWKAAAVRASFSVWFLPGTRSTSLLRLILVTQLPTYLAHFAAGMTGAFLYARWRSADRPGAARLAVMAQLVGATVVVWAMHAGGRRDLAGTAGTYDHWTQTLPVALGFAVLVLATALAPGWAQRAVTMAPARRVGDVSYGLYLWHSLVIGFALVTLGMAQDGTTGAFLRLLGLALGASLAIAAASLRWVERPAIDWARRRSRRLQGGPSPAVAAAGVGRPPPVSRPSPPC
jgi:peptidoglycan/LPS O-acetylase OafA/YrhL